MTIQPATKTSTKVIVFLLAFATLFTWMTFATKAMVAVGIIPPMSETSAYSQLSLPVFLAFFFFSNIWAPVWEEFCFRYAPIALAKLVPDGKAVLPIVIITSAFFGWQHHHGPYSLLLQGVMALVFSYVYLRNGIWWSIGLHSAWNILLNFVNLAKI